MKVIDNILLEWAYRCPDGIVDMNNPKKAKILKEILAEYKILTEDIDDDILNALSNLSPNDPKKEKILNYIQSSSPEQEKETEKLKQQIDGSEKEKEKKAKEIIKIRETLIAHGLSKPYAYFVTGIFIEADKEDELINYFQKLPSLEITDNTNIKSKPKKLLKSDNLVDEIYNHLAGSVKTKGVGKEENFLVIFYGNVVKEDEGDIKVDNTKYEVKGVGSMVVPSDIVRGSKKDVVAFLLSKLTLDDDQKTLLSRKERWTYTLSNIYNTSSDKSSFFKEVQGALKEKYSGLTISEDDLKDGKLLAKTITKYLIENSKIEDPILFISPEGVMKVYKNVKDLSDTIDKEINITGFSDFAPRLTFKDPENDISKQSEESITSKPKKEKKEIEVYEAFIKNIKDKGTYVLQNYIDKFPSIENQFDCGKGENFNTVKGNEKRFCLLKPDADIKIKSVKEKPGWLERYPNFLEEGISLQELSDTYHFQKRVTQRGNVLDILNLKEIPLKDFNLDEVKEKLKANISEELKTRILRILSKDVPLSNLYGVGIKVLKPVLVVDGKKYPLKLFAISTKEIKDKEGNIVDEKEVDNRGTLYFITIIDNKATTLLLLDKEDDSDLYFQIKKHLATKKIDRDAEVLSPPTYIYEINLDTLMGVKAQGPTLIDPSTLPYKVRTDYRVGANFDHIIFGTGKIVATSAGSGGKGDSAGKVDWVDVKFPKPHLKGGKFTDIRRFDKVYTLVSPILMK